MNVEFTRRQKDIPAGNDQGVIYTRKAKLALFLAGMALSCSTKSASQYQTSEMNAQMLAKATGNGSTDISVSLNQPSHPLTFLQLTSDDQFKASLGADTRTMTETSLLGAVSYRASFNTDAGGSEFHVKLIREMDSGAPDSYVTLPAEFTIEQLAKVSYSRNEQIDITWTSNASNDPMRLEVVASCLNHYQQELGTSAISAIIPIGALTKATANQDVTVPDECDGSIIITRSRLGTIDPAFAGGSFTGIQARTVNFHTAP